MKWTICYEGAYLEDGQPLFPERLSRDKLDELRRSQGVYKFANNYLNITVPDEDQDFKANWIRTYEHLPTDLYTFVFIDPAISLNDGADYTATIIVKVDCMKNWYVTMARRQRITATETLSWIFKIYEEFRPQAIGIEEVAYQSALKQFVAEEMLRRNQIIPLKGVKRGRFGTDGSIKSDNSKGARIRSLIPRFEFGKIFLSQGLDDFLIEYKSFPRGAHDDLLDALSSIEEIVFYPDKPKEVQIVRSPNDPGYEAAFIRSLHKKKARSETEDYE